MNPAAADPSCRPPSWYRRPATIYVALSVLAMGSVIFALTTGSHHVNLAQLWQTLGPTGDNLSRQVVLELRLPRALVAFSTGGLLALAGALMQVLLRNPLADPYVLGISGGAAVGALLALLFGAGSLLLGASALAGATAAGAIVFGLARGMGHWNPVRLLLTGIILAAGWNAVISFVLAVSPVSQLRGMLFWLMGDLSYAGRPHAGLIVLALGLLLSWPLGRQLNVLARGETLAGALGVDVSRLHPQLYLLAAVLTATAVTQAGSIGFVGLIVPHLLRLAGLRDHRLLLPAAVLFGGTLLVVADTLARSVLAPQQLPVGVITAALGVPLFLVLLRREARLQ